MTTTAGVCSFTRCTGCYCSIQKRSVGSLGDRKVRRGQLAYYLKRTGFPEGLKLAVSNDRHVVSKGSMKAMLFCCTSVDTASELGTHASIEWGASKVKLRLRVDHQIQFGEHVALLGSSESVGSWNDRVMMGWTEDGWVVDLEACPGEMIEYKYIVVTRDGNVIWEYGENRVLVVPDDFTKSYEVVSHWSNTGEAIDFEAIDESQAAEGEASGGETTEVEAEQGLKIEGGDSEVVDGIQSPEFDVIQVVKEVQNKTMSSKDVEETVLTEPELEDTEGNEIYSAIFKSVLPYYENFANPIVEDDFAFPTWWTPVSLILSFLLIVYGFLSLPQN